MLPINQLSLFRSVLYCPIDGRGQGYINRSSHLILRKNAGGQYLYNACLVPIVGEKKQEKGEKK